MLQKQGQEEKEGDDCLVIRKQGTASVSDTILNHFLLRLIIGQSQSFQPKNVQPVAFSSPGERREQRVWGQG